MIELYDSAEQYADEIINSEDFQKLLMLKEEIKSKLKNKIIGFKTAEAKYMEVRQYGQHHPDLNQYQQLFLDKKKALYSEPLIQEYKNLERKIQLKLNTDLNGLKKSVSNKFQLTKTFPF